MLLPLLAVAALGPSLTPTGLRADALVNPIGIDDATPVLSWYDTSPLRGDRQTAYRILVSSSQILVDHGIGDLWDSGRVNSDAMQVPYTGPEEPPGKPTYWKVQVWNATGDATSQDATWETGLMRHWKAQWISLPGIEKLDPRPASYLRKEFDCPKAVVSARLYVTGVGLYECYLDGHRIGSSELDPGWTDFSKRVQYQTFDVTKLLARRQHAIGIALGDGWYCGRIGWMKGNNYGSRPQGLVQLEIRYRDGSAETVASDPTWVATTGPILSDDLLMGEAYDATKELTGWSLPGYFARGWAAVASSAVDYTKMAPEGQYSQPVRKLLELKSKAITEPVKGAYVFDLGQNMVGRARLRVHGARGTTIQLRFAEMLNPDGTVYTTNLRSAKATDTYILSGARQEIFEPGFTNHGFRYVEVTGLPSKPQLGAITGVVVGSDTPQTGIFVCSNRDVNQLQHNIVWGQRGNYLSVPTDCPQRDERLGWMGDAEIFARTACFNSDVETFHTKWTQDVVDAQSAAGGFSDVSPRMGDPSDGAPAWGDAGVIVPWTIYRCYGDVRLLAERYPAMQKWIEYIDSANPDHLWINRSNNNFGDWLNVNDNTPAPVLAAAFFAHSTDLLAQTARVLGHNEDAVRYEELFRQIKAAYLQHYVAADGKIEGDSQTDYVLALSFHLIPDELRPNAAQRLVDHIEKDRKGHLSTGFVGSGMLNPTLTAAGRTDVAYKLLLTDTYPSWLYPIRQGATTIWERWDGWTRDKGFQDPGMNSFNHYSFGAVGEWLYSTVGGIDLDPTAPGYEQIVIHPIPGGGLTWAKTTLQSIRGLIAVEWHNQGGHFTMDVTIPANTTARIYIPATHPEDVTEGGQETPLAEGVKFDSMEAGYAIFQVGGGTYRFEALSPH